MPGAPIHVCGGPGCCAGHEEFLETANALVAECIVAPLPQPALNKWTRLGPTIARVALMSHFCGLLEHALHEEFGGLAERVEDEQEEAEEEQAEAVGLPLDERAAWKRVADKRRVKCVEFVRDKDASWGNLTWLTIASPILCLHWKLFKHVKWSSEVDTSKGEEPGKILRQFCVPSQNPAADVLDNLFQLLVDPERLRCLFYFHGPLAEWRPAQKLALQQLVLLAAGQLWRKLVMPWRSYPWKMWPLVWGDTVEAKAQAASELLAQRECCLDHVFSLKLQKLANGDPDMLVSPAANEFLHCCFTRAVATSTFVERRFASYGAWTARRASAPRLPTLAAKHVTSCVKEFVDAWRSRDEAGAAPGFKSRPVWQTTAAKGQRLTGLHVFAQEMRQRHLGGELRVGGEACSGFLTSTREKWAQLSAAERAPYTRAARERNAQAAALAQSAEQQEAKTGGPWGMASLSGMWPVEEGLVAAALTECNFQERAAQWRRDYRAVEEEASNVTEPGESQTRLFPQCPGGCCEAKIGQSQQAARQRLHSNLCTLVRAHYPTPDKLGSGVLALRVRSASKSDPELCSLLRNTHAAARMRSAGAAGKRRAGHGLGPVAAQAAGTGGQDGRCGHRLLLVRPRPRSGLGVQSAGLDVKCAAAGRSWRCAGPIACSY